MKIGVIVAMEKEFDQLAALLEKRHESSRHGKQFLCGHVGDSEIVLQKCGIGKVNAAVGTVEMIDGYAPDLVVSTGVAGGACRDMCPLDVVVGTEYAWHDVYCGSEVAYGQFAGLPPRFQATLPGQVKLTDVLGDLPPAAVPRIFPGLIVSGDWFVDTREKMQSILDHFPEARAVDMESCAIAQTCWLYEVPFVSFRIISDVPLKDTKAAQYYDFWDRLAQDSFEMTRTFLASLSHPRRQQD